MNQKYSLNTSYIPSYYNFYCSELVASTLFRVESTSNIKIIHHRVMGDPAASIWQGIWLMNACWFSQSVEFYQVLNAVSKMEKYFI